jgi:hypothetical protein
MPHRRIFGSHVRRAAEAGYIADTNVSFESVKKFVEERRYTIEFHPQGNSRIKLEAFNKLLPSHDSESSSRVAVAASR